MGKLALIGAILLGFHGPPAHRYWWVPTNNCTITSGTNRQGVWAAAPYIQCVNQAAGWHSTPQPPLVGEIDPNNPQTGCGQVWCGAPYKP